MNLNLAARLGRLNQHRALVKAAVPAVFMAGMFLSTGALATEGEGDPGVMADAVDSITNLTPGVKAIVAVVGFVVALISLAALRSFAAVLFFVGLAIFGSVGLTVANAVIAAPLSMI